MILIKIKSPLSSKRFNPDRKYNNSININKRENTPKRNLVKERQILINLDGSHPEKNYGREVRRREQTTRVQLT